MNPGAWCHLVQNVCPGSRTTQRALVVYLPTSVYSLEHAGQAWPDHSR